MCLLPIELKKDVFNGVWAERRRAVRLGPGNSSSVPQSLRIPHAMPLALQWRITESCWFCCQPAFLLLWVLRKDRLTVQGNAVNPEDFKPVSYLKARCCGCCRGEVDQCVELTRVALVSDLSLPSDPTANVALCNHSPERHCCFCFTLLFTCCSSFSHSLWCCFLPLKLVILL